jgi:dinuclear metal center YbgI/SA1388 family protein
MKLRDIYTLLDKITPFEAQESWDNSGLLVGRFDDEIEKIYLSLDIDSELISKLDNNSLIITHHPLIFKPLKRINFDSLPTKLLRELIKRDISLISIHTNFDKTHLNRYVVEDILGYKVVDIQNDFIFNFDVNLPFDEFYRILEERLNLTNKRVIKNHDFIKRASIVTGAGASFSPYIKTECFLTGDIKYHEAFESKELGLSMIDIDHFQSEKFFVDALAKEFDTKEIKYEILKSKNPFEAE